MSTSTMPPPPSIHTESARQATITTNSTNPQSAAGAEEDAEDEKTATKDSAAAPAIATTMDMSDALQRKMTELQASGWRPPEESIDSDDDYDAVDMISNSDEEEKSLRKAEEKLMADDDDEDEEQNAALARRLSLSSQNSNQVDSAYLEFNDDYLLGDDPFSQGLLNADQLVELPHFYRDDTPPPRAEHEANVATQQRRVRFEERADMSDETDSDADSDFFPDLFIQQDHLDPRFRRLIEKDDDNELYQDDSSNAGSEWDFEADEMRMLMMDDEDEDSDSSAGSSGYESDDGDTTDEEPMPPPPKKVSTAPTSPSSNAATPRASTRIRLPLRKNKNKRTPTQPKMGTFIIDPHRPVLTIDGVGVSQKSTLWPAKIQSDADKQLWNRMHLLSNNNSRATSRTTSPRQSVSVQLTPSGDSDAMSIGDENEFFDSFGALRTDQVIGPPEAFAPFVDVSASGAVIHDFDAVTTGAEDEGEQDPMCFLNFDDDDEDEEMPDESEHHMESPTTPSFSSQVTNTTSSQAGGFDLLAHLDRHGVVGSFRRNQQFAKHVGSLPSHPALRASLSETNAMQTGRRAAANTPITPLRKKKAKGVGARNSPMTSASPLKQSPPLKKGPVRGGFSRR